MEVNTTKLEAHTITMKLSGREMRQYYDFIRRVCMANKYVFESTAEYDFAWSLFNKLPNPHQ